jgi:serine/threonine protein kinase
MVELYDDQAKFVYMVLPFLEGKDLKERIEKKGPLSDCDAALVMFNLFEALDHMR